MNRRGVLVGAGTFVSSLLAGCLGDEGPSGPGTSTDGETETTTSTTTATATSPSSTTATTTAATTSAREPTTTTATGTDERTTRSETRTSTESPEPSTGSGSNRITDRALTVTDRACGNPTDEGTVAFEDGRVVVRGTITGSDSCTTAILDEATYDPSTDRLRVVVATESEREAGTTCAQCLTEIDYEGTIEFDDGVPKAVVLVHRGATGDGRVTTATA